MPPSPAAGAKLHRKSAASRAEASISPPVVAIESLQAADSFLLEKGRLEARAARLKADCDAAVAQVKAKYAELLVVRVDGHELPIADRLKSIDKALESFADEHRDEILEGDAKSRALNHGTIGWRKSAPALAPAKTKGAAGGNKELLEKIVGFLIEKLVRFDLFKVGVDRFVRLKVEWDKPALLAAIQKQEIDKVELRQAGFLLDEGGDVFFAEAQTQSLASQPGS